MANLINGFYQVNVGTNPNDGTGDSFRDCFIATNINFNKIANAGIGNTALDFTNSTISTAPGNNINFLVTGGYVNVGNAGTSLVGDSGNVQLGGGLTGQFLRTSDVTGNVYWSGGASGANGMVQYNQSGAFGAQSSFAYDDSLGRLSVQNLAVANDISAVGNLTASDATVRDISGRNFHFSGDGFIIGDFTVVGTVTTANATTVNIGNNVINIANTANSIILLEQSGLTWGNSAQIGTGNTPNIRFRDIGGSNIQQTVMAIYPGVWTTGLYISASSAPVAANLAPGYITLATDTRFVYQNYNNAADFSNLRADIFTSVNSNITKLTANTIDISTNVSNGSATAGRLLKIRNASAAAGNVGLQIVNQAGGAAAAWDIFSRAANGTLTFGWSADANGTGSNTRLELSNTGNIQAPYSTATNGFIGFGPGNAAHAGMRYVGSAYTLHVEANGAIDKLQLGTSGSSRVTVLGNAVAATAGFVGILNENPVSPLTVTGNTNGNRIQSGLTVGRTGLYAGSFTLGVDNNSNQFFIANSSVAGQGATMLVITGNNNLGLNIDQPRANVHVSSGATGVSANLAVQSPGGAEIDLTAYASYAAIGTANNFPLIFQVNGINAMTISTAGSFSGSFAPRVWSSTSITSPLAVDSDIYDIYAASSQAGNLVISADSTTPADGRKLIFRLTADGTARTVTFTGGVARGYKPVGVALVANGSNWNYTLTAGKTTYFNAMYNSASNRWEIESLSQET